MTVASQLAHRVVGRQEASRLARAVDKAILAPYKVKRGFALPASPLTNDTYLFRRLQTGLEGLEFRRVGPRKFTFRGTQLASVQGSAGEWLLARRKVAGFFDALARRVTWR